MHSALLVSPIGDRNAGFLSHGGTRDPRERLARRIERADSARSFITNQPICHDDMSSTSVGTTEGDRGDDGVRRAAGDTGSTRTSSSSAVSCSSSESAASSWRSGPTRCATTFACRSRCRSRPRRASLLGSRWWAADRARGPSTRRFEPRQRIDRHGAPVRDRGGDHGVACAGRFARRRPRSGPSTSTQRR